jgi:hypothetical protein
MEEDVAATQNGSHRHQANINEIKPDGACLQKSTHIKKTLELCQLVKRKETTTTTTTTTTTSGTKGKRRKKKGASRKRLKVSRRLS